ncbi:YlmC/YmxH family sporulation protein [Paenibacillus sp. Marseille-Q4541]|uniref:YlmC/YmxH family sporulation protein n=1 Tax=Paenibacillus sp. Marseille-Q4541 TaxID=2831522 RepID=UPI001BA627FF|nr:YlmC/YmxH family sporulation protein [Paenibacillus sp. Marseille-Q4541]
MSTGDLTVRAMKISDFQTKDVINIIDGKRLGQISDLELDLRHGRIEAIVVPSYSRFMGLFGGGSDLIIPWRNIVKIGSDVVLVKMDEIKERPEDGEQSHAERLERIREDQRRGF